jgi:PAS domain-containing protein
MRAICAWCNADLGPRPDTSSDGHDITHSICDTCAHRLFDAPHPTAPPPRTLAASVRRFLNSLTGPVIAVDENVRVIDANDAALATLGTTRTRAIGALGGDVIACANASLAGGCGQTAHCAPASRTRTPRAAQSRTTRCGSIARHRRRPNTPARFASSCRCRKWGTPS